MIGNLYSLNSFLNIIQNQEFQKINHKHKHCLPLVFLDCLQNYLLRFNLLTNMENV